ncbi:MAG: radical SAM family heme chaperone HemW [Eubacterium sp.]|nr:radical SAM family heme chaperone HemW [Eubacterium sp.]
MKELSIYIHIPFCVRKCLYCDFLSFPMLSREKMESYVNLLEREIKANAEKYEEYQVISIFLGGGTPSILPAEEISRIMTAIRDCYRVAEDAEITMEMNPGTADSSKMLQYIASGINRISIGLQSADDRELVRIGRIHDRKAFQETYRLARNAGFRNVNIDIMSSLPGQSVASYEKTLAFVAACGPEHISAYSLMLEEGTPLYERQEEYSFLSEDKDREMYALTKEYLASCGYHRYEISNYARTGFECRHNKVYWQRGNYVGFGLGASSMIENVRWKNPEKMEIYRAYVSRMSKGQEQKGEENSCAGSAEPANVQGRNAEKEIDNLFGIDRQILSVQEQMEEYMFLGMRMMRGIDRREFARIFGRRTDEVYAGIVDRLCRQGLIEQDTTHIRLTDFGIDVSNYVLAQFLLD